MKAIAAIAASTAALLLLSGCTGNAVTIAGQGYTTGVQTRTLQCGTTGPTSGTVSYGEQGAGGLHVKVQDGRGATVHESGGGGANAGQAGASARVSGESGTWTLSADSGSLGYAGQWAVTLSC